MALINCPECRKEISDKVKDCPNCGYPVNDDVVKDLNIGFRPESIDKVSEDNKPTSVKLIIGIGIIAISFIVTLIYLNNSPYNKFVRALKNEDIKTTAEVFAEMKDEKIIEKAKEHVVKKIDKLESDYIGGKMEYLDVLDQLKGIKDLNIEGKKVSKTRENIVNLDNSEKAYEKMVKFFEEGKYKETIVEASSVIKDDNNYESSLKLKGQALVEFEAKILDEAKVLASKNDFIGAIKILDKDKNLLGDTKRIDGLIDDYKGGASADIITNAIEKLDLNNYEEALGILNDNISYSSNNNIQDEIERIKQKKVEYNKGLVVDIKDRLVVNYDNVEKKHNIAPKGYSTRYVNIDRTINIEPRISFTDSPTFVLCVGFQQSDWVFFEKVIFVVDDSKYEWELDYFDRGSQVGNGIAEWYLVAHDDLLAGYNNNIKDLSLLINSLINSENATIRFQGTGYRDHTVTKKEVQTIKDLWNLYKILDEDPGVLELIK